MSKPSAEIAALIQSCQGRSHDARYLAFFECFNRGLFFEAHAVLEALWLKDRSGPNASFHKGLIQLAGAFLHLQKGRLQPSAALFTLARANLRRYPARHAGLDVAQVLALIDDWLAKLEAPDFKENPLGDKAAPRLPPPAG